jgi:hypothetical protein
MDENDRLIQTAALGLAYHQMQGRIVTGYELAYEMAPSFDQDANELHVFLADNWLKVRYLCSHIIFWTKQNIPQDEVVQSPLTE